MNDSYVKMNEERFKETDYLKMMANPNYENMIKEPDGVQYVNVEVGLSTNFWIY